MSMSVTTNDGETLIKLEEVFDFNSQAQFRKAYEQEPVAKKIVIDFKKTNYLDSAALGMLLLLREKVNKDSGRVKLINLNGQVNSILKIANFHKLFEIEPSYE